LTEKKSGGSIKKFAAENALGQRSETKFEKTLKNILTMSERHVNIKKFAGENSSPVNHEH